MMHERLAARLALLALLWITATGVSGGCQMFRPASAERPQAGTSIREDFTDPESTLATMSRAVSAKVNGTTAYMNALATPGRDNLTFSATFDAAVVLASGKTPPEWDDSFERVFFGTYFTKRSGRDSLGWSTIDAEPDPDPTGADSRVLNRHYEVWNIVPQGEGSSSRIRVAIGNATLTFRRISTRWVLLNWSDRVDPSIGVNPIGDDDRSFSWRRLEAIG